jgi:type I site-specific restriction endonuclease
MTIPLDVTPSAHLPISVARQAQIIDAINKTLTLHPRQGLCLMGSPGTGKTYLMQAIQRSVLKSYEPRLGMVKHYDPQLGLVKYDDPRMTATRPTCYMTTLAEWQESNLDRSRRVHSPLADDISAKTIRKIADNIRPNKPPDQSLHYFIDEFDSQPTVSQFSSSKLQTFVNACYENAPRNRPGNGADFVQLVVAMNKSWAEFESAYGTHVARRIAEMCVRIDFDKAVITDPEPDPDTPDAIDQLVAGWFDDFTIKFER